MAAFIVASAVVDWPGSVGLALGLGLAGLDLCCRNKWSVEAAYLLMAGELTGMKILVVDDFATMRRIIKNLLHTLGYTQVDEAEDGTVALPMLHNDEYDFLITDLNMPGMSGLELLRAVRSDNVLCKLPVLVVTADANRDQIIAAAKAGVDGYMVKPFSAAVLQDKINAILARTGRAQGLKSLAGKDAAD